MLWAELNRRLLEKTMRFLSRNKSILMDNLATIHNLTNLSAPYYPPSLTLSTLSYHLYPLLPFLSSS
jgi:hypothetical protein